MRSPAIASDNALHCPPELLDLVPSFAVLCMLLELVLGKVNRTGEVEA